LITTLIDELLDELRAAEHRRDDSPTGTAAWACSDREVHEFRDALRAEARRVATRPLGVSAVAGTPNSVSQRHA
jgi:argininosuccinate lyase